MQEGVVENLDEEIAEFLINEGYGNDVVPICAIQGGSRAYSLDGSDSDRDYYGVHFMDTWECLQHPDFRKDRQVIRRAYNSNFEEMASGAKGSEISLTSFEVWKFISMLLKGSPVVYELLYLPPVHLDPGSDNFFQLCRAGLTNRIGKAAKGSALHLWRKDKQHRKRTILTLYRLLQAIYFLRETEFEWNAHSLFEYANAANLVTVSKQILSEYKEIETRRTRIDEALIPGLSSEIEKLVDEVDKALVVTTLPDQCPRQVLDAILKCAKQIRSAMI